MKQKAYQLLAIVGPTASGKSTLAMKIAKQFNGEIITADSRTVYKGMDIATAKPSVSDMAKVKHWGIDLIEPGEAFSAARFKDYARKTIKDIWSRGRLPIIAGGTGLYIDGLLYSFKFGPPAVKKQREKLQKMDIEQLQELIKEASYQMPENLSNPRHLIRTLERKGSSIQKKGLMPGVLLVGIQLSDKQQHKNISVRAKEMIKNGVLEETQLLKDRYGRGALETTGGIGYKIWLKVLDGKLALDEAEQIFIEKDWQYSRRQKTWFKRNKDINWFKSSQEAYLHLKNLLNT